jgi:hypothetical protein
LLNAFELGAGGGVEGVLLFEEDTRKPGSGDDGGEMAKALCGEPPGVFVVLRVSSVESPNDVDLVGDANGDSAVEEKFLPAVGVPNTEVLAAPSVAFNGVPKAAEELEAKEANPPVDAEALGVAAVNALNPPPDCFELLAPPKVDAKAFGELDVKALKAPPESLLSLAFLVASKAEPKVVGAPDANALNPLAVAVLVSGEPKTDVFAGADWLPKVAGALAKAENPLAEVEGVMPKLGFPKAGCPNEVFPKAGDADPD